MRFYLPGTRFSAVICRFTGIYLKNGGRRSKRRHSPHMQASPAIKQGRAQAPASLNGLLHSGSLGSSAAGSASFFMGSSGTACLRLLLLTGLEHPLDQQGAFPGPSGPDQVMVHSVGMPFRKGLGHERFPPVLPVMPVVFYLSKMVKSSISFIKET